MDPEELARLAAEQERALEETAAPPVAPSGRDPNLPTLSELTSAVPRAPRPPTGPALMPPTKPPPGVPFSFSDLANRVLQAQPLAPAPPPDSAPVSVPAPRPVAALPQSVRAVYRMPAPESGRLLGEQQAIEDRLYAEQARQLAEELTSTKEARQSGEAQERAHQADLVSMRAHADETLKLRDEALTAYKQGVVDPDRLIRNKSVASKIAAFASAVAGGVLLGMGRTQTNQALDRMDREIDQDIQLQEKELAQKLMTSRELAASHDEIVKTMDRARILSAAKREVFWQGQARRLDEIALSHKGAINEETRAWARKEMERRAAAAREQAYALAISSAARARKAAREKAWERTMDIAKTAESTLGAAPVNIPLLTEQAESALTGELKTYATPEGQRRVLPPGVISSPDSAGKLSEATIKEHEKAADYGNIAHGLMRLDTLYESAPVGQRLSGLGDLGNEIAQTQEDLIEAMMRVGLTSDKDRAGIAKKLTRGITQSQDSYRRNVSDLLRGKLARIADPRAKALAEQMFQEAAQRNK